MAVNGTLFTTAEPLFQFTRHHFVNSIIEYKRASRERCVCDLRGERAVGVLIGRFLRADKSASPASPRDLAICEIFFDFFRKNKHLSPTAATAPAHNPHAQQQHERQQQQ
jgi:hypothetical protein